MRLHMLEALAAVLVLGIGAQWLAWRLRLPAILLLLIFGFLAGPLSGALGLSSPLVEPDKLFGPLLLPLVSLSVGLILFEGGLSLRFRELRGTHRAVLNLVSIGMLVSWLVTAAAAYLILQLDLRLALLLGAILVVTGPTVIGPLLRHVRPSGPVGSILKWEGIVIDPIGVLLTVLVFEAIASADVSHAAAAMALSILKTAVVGVGLGYVSGVALGWLLARHAVPDYLQSGVALMFAAASFVVSNMVQEESGLFTTTVLGIVLANRPTVSVRHILEFKENLRTLLISSLFILLAARMTLEELYVLGPGCLLFIAALMLIGRPLSVLLSTATTEVPWRERLYLSCLAPRGIVAAATSSVFAIELEQRGVPGASLLAPITFAVIIATVAVYGIAARPLAILLGLTDPNPQGVLIVGAHDWARGIAQALSDLGVRVLLVDTNPYNIHAARLAKLPAYTGNVFDETIVDDLNLAGLGWMMSLTANAGVNLIARDRFQPVFGRPRTFRLATDIKAAQDDKAPDPILFGKGMTFEKLREMFSRNWKLRTFPAASGKVHDPLPAGSIPLFGVGAKGSVRVWTNLTEPRKDETVLAVVSPNAETTPAPQTVAAAKP